MKLKRVLASLLLAVSLFALPVCAESGKGEANITPDTPMTELRANPSVIGAGLYTYNQEQDNPRDIRKWKNTTLREYVNSYTAEDCAKGINRMIENYNNGIQITYKLYTEEEIAAVPTRQKAEIYYFPGSNPNGKFMLVIGGIGTVPGAVIGTILVMVIPEVLRFLDGYYWLVFSIIALLFVIFMPYGLVSLFDGDRKTAGLLTKLRRKPSAEMKGGEGA